MHKTTVFVIFSWRVVVELGIHRNISHLAADVIVRVHIVVQNTLGSAFKVGVPLLRNFSGRLVGLFRNALEEIFKASDKLVTVTLDGIDSSFRIGDGKENQDGFNESPAVVAGTDEDNEDHDGAPLHAKEPSLTVEVLRSELSTTEAHVSRDLAVARRLGEVVSFSTLVLLHEGLDSGLSTVRKLGFSLGAGHGAGFAEVADVALVIELSARACATVDNSIKVLAVETLNIGLSSHVRHLLS